MFFYERLSSKLSFRRCILLSHFYLHFKRCVIKAETSKLINKSIKTNCINKVKFKRLLFTPNLMTGSHCTFLSHVQTIFLLLFLFFFVKTKNRSDCHHTNHSSIDITTLKSSNHSSKLFFLSAAIRDSHYIFKHQ